MTVVDTTPPPVTRGLHRTLWALQGVLGVFLIVASAGPKLFGETNAVQTFEDMGAAPWFRYLVGLLELAGGVGLLVPRLAGLAAVGLALLMVGAAVTQAFILDGGALLLTPVVLFALFVFIAWGRRHSIRRLLKR
ncbi:DoxX family protein [Micromonospora sp. C28ISP2-4]|uniref:DoxX family protein n=1 Tax=Micromonospora sp. C28ISP2-4 TaxID=3059523 RepID=UPI00267738C7|nr:DoxX family protein [Micromonospora sp. C28ISP2-4]MDO3684920.1 DoxX family protein [Micromonospora sp. C28ISP2-4]